MTKHVASVLFPPLIDDERFSSNGMLPDAALLRRLAETLNWVAAKAKKQVFTKCQPLDAVLAGDPANVVWPAYFRTGENVRGLHVACGIALTDYSFSSMPEVNLIVKDTTPTTVINKSWTFPASSAGTVVTPDELNHVEEYVGGLLPNTEYYAYWQLTNGARLVYASLTEAQGADDADLGASHYVDDTVAGVSDPTPFLAEAPIYDAGIADLVTANNLLWRHNGAHLIGWCPDYDEDDGPLTSSFASPMTYTNVLDTSSTSVTSSSFGWKLFTQYHNTVNRTTVPVKLAVRSNRTSGGGTLDVRLTDGTNNIDITGIVDLGGGWSTVTANIPAQAGTKWDLQARVSFHTSVFCISGLALFEYEA
jgi:hypothetical protein